MPPSGTPNDKGATHSHRLDPPTLAPAPSETNCSSSKAPAAARSLGTFARRANPDSESRKRDKHPAKTGDPQTHKSSASARTSHHITAPASHPLPLSTHPS